MSTYSVTVTQEVDLAVDPTPDGTENYSLTTTFSNADPAVGPFSDGAFILVKKEATEDDDIYQKICTYADVIRYGTDRAAATTYYRKTVWILELQSLEEISAAAALQLQRVQYLCDDFSSYDAGPWPDETVTVVTSA